jgi:hypothetical protein
MFGFFFMREAVWDLVTEFQHVEIRPTPRCQDTVGSVGAGGGPQIPLGGVQKLLELASA